LTARVRKLAALGLGLGLAISHAAHAGNDLQDAAGAAAGIFAGIYVHELGHAAVFKANAATGIRIHVPGRQCNLLCGETEGMWPARPTRATAQASAVAGFVTSNLATEALLHNPGAARSGFGQGFIAANLYSNVAHVVTYYTRIRGRNGYKGNDIDDVEVAGGNPHLLSAGLVAYSVWTLHRMKKKEIPVMFVKLHF
jgi:hypothetical protein